MKYKLQSFGVLDTETGASIPSSEGNRHWRMYLEWVAEGNTADPEFTTTEIDDATKADKIQELKDEGLTRIQAVMPAIDNFNTLELVREMWLSTAPAARNATATFQSIIDIYQAARNGVITLKSAAPEEVAAYDVLVDTAWPV